MRSASECASTPASAQTGSISTSATGFAPFNPNTADWSVGVAGYWFENGEIAHPVSEITVAGNLLDIFKRLRTGSDLDNRGSLEISSLIVDDLAIGGV